MLQLFPHRVVHMWNELLEEVGEADTVRTFKRHLDMCMDRKGLEEHGQGSGKRDDFGTAPWSACVLHQRACFHDV